MKRLTITSILLAVLCTLALVALLLTPRCSKKSPESTKIKVGYLPITADVSFFVALEKGFFKKEKVSIEPVRFTSSNQAMDSLLTGRIDGAIMIGYSTLFTIFSKSPDSFRIVQSGVETKDKFTAKIIVPKNSDVEKIEDLKGKKIGTYSGLTQRLNLLLVLSHFFEKPEEAVEIIQVESNLQVPSLAANRFDALFTIDPHATVAIQKGIGRSICDSPRAKYIVNPFPTCATVLSTSLINQKPKVAKKIIKALDAASEWAVKNPTEASLVISNEKYTSVSPEIALACGTYEWWKLGEEDFKAVEKLTKIMRDNDLLEKNINIRDMYALNE